MSSFWEKFRKDFPITKQSIYLDHASGGPMPLPVYEKVAAHYRENTEQADFAWMKWIREREKAREKTARFINASPEEIAFTQCTSHGMNLIAELLAGQGAVLTNEAEFPSSTVPWISRKAKLVWQKPVQNRVDLETLRGKLSPEIKTILGSYVQYATGFRQDLPALGKIKGKRLLVINAAQGFGALPVDVEKWRADFLVTNSYKWMMAGYGAGILYVRKKWLKKFRPQTVGWRSVMAPEKMDNRNIPLNPGAMRYELGCPGFPAIIAFGAAVDYLSAIGMDKIEERILDLTDYLTVKLEQRGFKVVSPRRNSEKSGIVVFKAAKAQLLWKRLLAKGIYVSPRGEGIRVAPHFYNSFEDIDGLIRAIQDER